MIFILIWKGDFVQKMRRYTCWHDCRREESALPPLCDIKRFFCAQRCLLVRTRMWSIYILRDCSWLVGRVHNSQKFENCSWGCQAFLLPFATFFKSVCATEVETAPHTWVNGRTKKTRRDIRQLFDGLKGDKKQVRRASSCLHLYKLVAIPRTNIKEKLRHLCDKRQT